MSPNHPQPHENTFDVTARHCLDLLIEEAEFSVFPFKADTAALLFYSLCRSSPCE